MPVDKRHDDFYERFLEQRFQKIKNPGQSSMEDSLQFPIELLRTAPVTLPQKLPVSNTSSDSGVNSPNVLSPAMPKTPDNSQLHLIPTTSLLHPPSGPLTPVHQFIEISRKSNTRGPNKIALSLIILIHSRCSKLALGKAISSFFQLLYDFFMTF